MARLEKHMQFSDIAVVIGLGLASLSYFLTQKYSNYTGVIPLELERFREEAKEIPRQWPKPAVFLRNHPALKSLGAVLLLWLFNAALFGTVFLSGLEWYGFLVLAGATAGEVIFIDWLRQKNGAFYRANHEERMFLSTLPVIILRGCYCGADLPKPGLPTRFALKHWDSGNLFQLEMRLAEAKKYPTPEPRTTVTVMCFMEANDSGPHVDGRVMALFVGAIPGAEEEHQKAPAPRFRDTTYDDLVKVKAASAY